MREESSVSFFFFQAEDGIRDATVTGVQTCALPISIVTVGNELVSGDVENTNGSWLARRLAGLGIEVALIAVLPDDVDQVAAFVREQAAAADAVLVTGGLGGTPDDVTREAI